MIGGGFGSCIISLAKTDQIENFRQSIARYASQRH